MTEGSLPRDESAATAGGETAGHDEPRQPLWLDVVEDGGTWAGLGDLDRLAAITAEAIAAHGALDAFLPAVAAVALSSDAAVRRLNSSYRAKDKPTNVLSFPFEGAGEPIPGRRMLGDIVLADGVIAREAAELGIPPAHHFQHLVVHGVLHLMGYDHETETEAVAMERLETEILARLGIADPHGAMA